MSGIQWKNTPLNVLENFTLIYKLVSWVAGSQWAWTTLKLRRWVGRDKLAENTSQFPLRQVD